MKLFTDYTNKWKGNVIESKEHIDSGKPHTLDKIKDETEKKLKLNPVRSGLRGNQFKPKLPLPEVKKPTTQLISYRKRSDDIQTVQNDLFGDQEVSPSKVGEECFDLILEEAQQ